MANLRTAQAIIDIAYGRSKRADPDAEDTTPEELLAKLDEVIGTYFQEGTRINPDYFGKREEIEFDEALQGWPRPREAEAILRIENAAGLEVTNVPFDDRDAEPGPGVYGYGAVYYRKDDSVQPSGNLTFFYSRRPAPTGTVEAEIDALWPRGHETLLSLELAMYLAKKDTRKGDLELLGPQRDRQMLRFGRFIEHQDTTVRRRKAKSKVFSSGPLKPVMS